MNNMEDINFTKVHGNQFEFERVQRGLAEPMTRLEYNQFRGWTLSLDEDGDDTGYKLTVDSHISWIPDEVFEAECSIRSNDFSGFAVC